MSDTDLLARALLTRLDLEHEAVWLLGVIGGRVEPLRKRASRSFTAHRAARDRLLRQLRRLDAPTSDPRASYGQPPTDADSAEQAVVDLERRISAACLQVVTATEPEHRERPVDDLRKAALATLTWGGSPQAFPGLD